jgi:hypothetical protein
MGKPYDYREPKEDCWFVSLGRSDVQMVGGDSRLVLISQDTGRLINEYIIPGE